MVEWFIFFNNTNWWIRKNFYKTCKIMFYQTESLEITLYRISNRIVTKLFLITRHSFKVILTYILNTQVTNIAFSFINITTAEGAIVKEWPDLVGKKVEALLSIMMGYKIWELKWWEKWVFEGGCPFSVPMLLRDVNVVR